MQRRIQINQLITTKVSIKKLFLSILILLVSGVVVLKFYGLVVDNGMLGENAQQKYELQAGGEFGLLIGGRQELLIASLAIIDSPIIGHGSWAKDFKYLALLPSLLLKYSYDKLEPVVYNELMTGLIPAHSFLLGAWVYSGLLGAVFWFWVMVFCMKLLLVLYKTKDPLTPVVAFVCFNMFWNILFSPFGAETRLYTAYFLVLLMFVHSRLLIKQEALLSKSVTNRLQETTNF
jgi:O-antigen ligase